MMVRNCLKSVVLASICGAVWSNAAETVTVAETEAAPVTVPPSQEERPTVKLSAKLELFYEYSKDIKGEGDNDQFKSNELYLIFDGTYPGGWFGRLVLDGADLENGDGDAVSAKVVEEANFGIREPGGLPVEITFGKDEMPFGMDYDKYLNDSIAHQFEIDKVWGFHGIVTVDGVGSVAAATYQHRHSEDEEEGASNRLGDNFAGRVTLDQLVEDLTVNISCMSETYRDTSSTDESTGAVTAFSKDDMLGWGIGAVYAIKGLGNLNAEYLGFTNLKGRPDYDPYLLTLGVEVDVIDEVKVWGRYEFVGEDSSIAVDTDFWSVGVKYTPTKNFAVMAEYSNFNSRNISDAKDLQVADSSSEDAVLFGVRAKF